MSVELRFLKPVDVLFFRSNRLFDSAGSYSEAVMPPPPSVFSGALRSFLMAENGFDPSLFRDRSPGASLAKVVGAGPGSPGSFRVSLAAIGSQERLLIPLPADLVAFGSGPSVRAVLSLQPVERTALQPCRSSGDLPMLPVLKAPTREKPMSGLFLDPAGQQAYLRGGTVNSAHLVRAKDLWSTDSRLGIGMDASTRRVQTGRLYTSDGIAFKDGYGFIAGVAGSTGFLPKQGLLRLGGDGHGAEVRSFNPPAFRPWEFVPSGERFRMVLSTPGLFPEGWLPPGVTRRDDGHHRLEYTFEGGRAFRARLASAAVNRSEVVSGWNLAREAGGFPKPAQRSVSSGSVYWFDRVEGDLGRFCRLILAEGLWPLMTDEINKDATGLWKARRAEGFNNVWFGEWKG